MTMLFAQEHLLVTFVQFQSDPSSAVLTESDFQAFLTDMQKEKPTEMDHAIRYIRQMKEPFRITDENAKKEDQVGP